MGKLNYRLYFVMSISSLITKYYSVYKHSLCNFLFNFVRCIKILSPLKNVTLVCTLYQNSKS